MKKFKATVTLIGLLLTRANATWCQFFYDNQCRNTANPTSESSSDAVSFDCANPTIFGTGGGFVPCHNTDGNATPCTVKVYSAKENGDLLGISHIFAWEPDPFKNGVSPCEQMNGGAGPWVSLTFDP